ncbi:MAG: M1 family metallopeptidase [Longimicrobiales bacterium]|nr:M1 family metallopeptidase [Longimicrobiales bacterium]
MRVALVAMVAGLWSVHPTLAQQDARPNGNGNAASTADRPGPRVLRPVPAPVVPPPEFQAALRRGTRAVDGRPGPRYWTQWTTYDIDATLDPATGVLVGSERIVYHNRSPDTLAVLGLNLYQNLHEEGVVRNEPQEITGGIDLRRVAARGRELEEGIQGPAPGYVVSGTVMTLRPRDPVLPGDSVEIEIDWTVTLPQSGAGRMGWSDRDVYFVAYWFPRMAVYDDLRGWDAEPYRGNAEFHDGFGDYRVSLAVPGGWTVMATGELENPEEVYTERTLEGIDVASRADTIVTVATGVDRARGQVTLQASEAERLSYEFRADSVRDFAWTASETQRWTATSARLPDRDGDGAEDRVLIHTFWRPDRAPLWAEQALYAKHSVEFESRYTGHPYPWSHMTSVEGADIIGGGMEFPMITVMGSYEGLGAQALYNVTAHEIGHMWIPMIAGTNERRYAWMDEGLTSFLENQARPDFTPGDPAEIMERENYLGMARNRVEHPLMRHGDEYGPGAEYTVASYWKPATLFVTLRELIGEEVFRRAYRGFIDDWAYAHPTPWDLFNAFEREASRDLDWFWTSWFYETWLLDHAVAGVEPAEDGPDGEERSVVIVEDQGWAVMPARIRVTTEDGSTFERSVPVDRWLSGAVEARVEIPVPVDEVERVEIDPERQFPDADRSDNVWERP